MPERHESVVETVRTNTRAIGMREVRLTVSEVGTVVVPTASSPPTLCSNAPGVGRKI